jgi:CubicO group peptidase (beta-lactamase class C family)
MARRSRTVLIIALAIVATALVRADGVDDFVNARLRERHIPGASIAVVKDGTLIKSAGYGVADLENDIAARPDTVYKIGSTSKQFIAAGIMLLAQDGKLRVADTVGRHLPGVPPSWQAITLRHLLTHTSGLVREAPAFDFFKVQPDLDVIASAYAVPLRFGLGDKWEYSNLGYFLLAEIITRASGKPWAEFLHERIFAPLGMTMTRPTTASDIVRNRSDGYIWENNKHTIAWNFPAVRPSGAFLSTVVDLAKWEAALQQDKVLTAATKAEMWTPVVLSSGQKYPYGYGWELDDFPPGGFATGVTAIRHEGTMPGFRAAFTRLPQQRLAVIVLTNLNGAQVDLIVAGIAVRYAPELMPAALKRWKPEQLQ